MEEEKQISSYYRNTIVRLIEKYKTAIDQCIDVIGQAIDKDLKDDRLENVLKAKRRASEDAKWYAQEIDRMEAELNGEEQEEHKEIKTETVTSWTKRKAN